MNTDEFWKLLADVINEEFVMAEQFITPTLVQQLFKVASEQLTDPTPSA